MEAPPRTSGLSRITTQLPVELFSIIAENDPAVAKRLYQHGTKRISKAVKSTLATSVCRDPISLNEFVSTVINVVDTFTVDSNSATIYVRLPITYEKRYGNSAKAFRMEISVSEPEEISIQYVRFGGPPEKKKSKSPKARKGRGRSTTAEVESYTYPFPIKKKDIERIRKEIESKAAFMFDLPDYVVDLKTQADIYSNRHICIGQDKYYVAKMVSASLLPEMEIISPPKITGYTAIDLIINYHGNKNEKTLLIPDNGVGPLDDLINYISELDIVEEEEINDEEETTPNEQLRYLLDGVFLFLQSLGSEATSIPIEKVTNEDVKEAEEVEP